MSLLENNTTKKEQKDQTVLELNFNVNNNNEYKLKAIQESVVYIHKAKNYLLDFYYLLAK